MYIICLTSYAPNMNFVYKKRYVNYVNTIANVDILHIYYNNNKKRTKTTKNEKKNHQKKTKQTPPPPENTKHKHTSVVKTFKKSSYILFSKFTVEHFLFGQHLI